MSCLSPPPSPGPETKASRLSLLRSAGLRVPDFVLLSSSGCDEEAIGRGLKEVLGAPPYIVRPCGGLLVGKPALALSASEVLEAARTMEQTVIVQKAVNARASGFAYTANPVSGSVDLIYVDSVVGLGLRLSYEGAPHDEVRVTRDRPRVYDVRVMAKPTALVLDVDGKVLEEPLQDPYVQSISDEEAIEVATAALEVERAMGGPVELSWAIDEDGSMWALGVRGLRSLG